MPRELSCIHCIVCAFCRAIETDLDVSHAVSDDNATAVAMFDFLDTDHDGKVSKIELMDFCSSTNVRKVDTCT